MCLNAVTYIFRGSVFDKIEEEEDEDGGGDEEEDEGESFKTDIEVDDRTYSVGNESLMNEGLRSRVKATFNIIGRLFNTQL